MLRIGLFSNRSAGVGRTEKSVCATSSSANSIPIIRAVRASPSRGAETYATTTETITSTAAIVMLCQRKIVCVSGITPVIGRSAAGIDDFVACRSAADDDNPSAQTLPSPRYAAAPMAR